jgi:hypothetical protein
MPAAWSGKDRETCGTRPTRTDRKKEALVRCVNKLNHQAVILIEDETILWLFPPLRAKWACKGSQPKARISGANDRRVLFDTIS